MGNFIFELSEGREVITVEDFLELMAQDPQKYSFGYVYYTYPAKLANESKVRNPSEFMGRIFKHKPYKFRWEETYRDLMLRQDPNFVFKGGRTKYKPIKGMKFMVDGPNGRYFPIVPIEDGMFHTVYTIDWKVVPYEEVAQHLKPPSGFIPPKIPMLEERIAGVAAGGAFLQNPKFKFKYMGEGEQASRFK